MKKTIEGFSSTKEHDLAEFKLEIEPVWRETENKVKILFTLLILYFKMW